VNRIDKTFPTATNVSYSPSTNTNGSVTVTLTTSESVQSITGRSGGPTIRTKTYVSNTTETITFYDQVGNVGSTGIEITRIDTSAVT